jgi:hypothetical protein
MVDSEVEKATASGRDQRKSPAAVCTAELSKRMTRNRLGQRWTGKKEHAGYQCIDNFGRFLCTEKIKPISYKKRSNG